MLDSTLIRFRKLAEKAHIRPSKPASSAPPHDEDVEIAEWVRTSRCKDVMLPWLRKHIKIAELERDRSYREHQDLLVHLGIVTGLKRIESALTNWLGAKDNDQAIL